ncbi:transcription termination factor 4, mitochondrial isoform 1-T1 [Pholidichthys leucotaenia]
MGTRVVVVQIARLAAARSVSSVPSPLNVGRCLIRSRLFCSSSSQSAHDHDLHPLPGKLHSELPLRSLVDMGFTDIQAKHIYEAVSTIGGGSAAKHTLSTLTALFMLGFNTSSVLKLLEKCPELYTTKEKQLQERISNLRKMGLVEGSLQRVVSYYPKILTVPVKTVKHVVLFLKEKCLFTAQQVTDILRESPAVVLEDLGQLEYKFQYVYFKMGVKQAEMVKCRLFRVSLDEVRCRHSFLERRGLYVTPDKKGQTVIINPKLAAVLNTDQDTFLTRVAQASAEEYKVFQKLVAREWREEELQQGRIEADGDEEEEDGDGDEEETSGKSGYGKRRRK